MDMVNFWERKYRRNLGRIVAICYRYVNDRAMAEDLAQDVFVKAMEKFTTIRALGQLPEIQRTVFNLHAMERYSYRHIARMLGILYGVFPIIGFANFGEYRVFRDFDDLCPFLERQSILSGSVNLQYHYYFNKYSALDIDVSWAMYKHHNNSGGKPLQIWQRILALHLCTDRLQRPLSPLRKK